MKRRTTLVEVPYLEEEEEEDEDEEEEEEEEEDLLAKVIRSKPSGQNKPILPIVRRKEVKQEISEDGFIEQLRVLMERFNIDGRVIILPKDIDVIDLTNSGN